MIPAAVLDFPSPINCNPSLGSPTLGKCLTGITKGVASDAFSSIAAAFAKAADSTINWLWQQMSTATAIHLGGTAFNQLFDVALAVAVVLAVGIFAAQMCRLRVRHDPAGISRAAVGLVVMGVGGGAAVAITDLLLQAVDAVSAGVLQVTTGDTIAQMGNSLLASGSITASTTNPAGLILISLFALAAVVMVWLALTVRKMLVIVAAVLAPFVFAGSVADFSRSWVRRWVEIVVALVFSKLILMFVFVIGLFVLIRGVGSTGTGGAQGITQTVSGILILALAGFSPWVAIKHGPLRRPQPGRHARPGRRRHRGSHHGAVDGTPHRRCPGARGEHGRHGWRVGLVRQALVAADDRHRPGADEHERRGADTACRLEPVREWRRHECRCRWRSCRGGQLRRRTGQPQRFDAGFRRSDDVRRGQPSPDLGHRHRRLAGTAPERQPIRRATAIRTPRVRPALVFCSGFDQPPRTRFLAVRPGGPQHHAGMGQPDPATLTAERS